MRRRLKDLFNASAPSEKSHKVGGGLSYTVRYALVGVFIGLLFVVLAVGLLATTLVSSSESGLIGLLQSEPLFWIIASAPFFVLGLFAAVAGWREDQLHQMNAHLQQEREQASLHAAKAADLERRTAQLDATIEISSRLSNILDLDELMTQVVRQVKDKFDYYHAQIYLLNKDRRELIGATGTGQFDPRLESGGYSIPLDDSTSLVARAARIGDIATLERAPGAGSGVSYPQPAKAYSRMAVPIILDGQVAGVLEVHEDQAAGGLTEADANLLRSLATQLAIAMRNARLFKDVESNLIEVRELQQRYIRRSWDRSLLARHGSGRVQFSIEESTTLSETTIAKARDLAFKQTEPTPVTLDPSQDGEKPASRSGETEAGDDPSKSVAVDPARHLLVAPIVLRQVSIGNVQLHGVDPERAWTEGELAFISAIIDQVAQSAENLRLIDEATERASREQLISQISDRLRRTSDIESLMKVGVEELSRVLRPARTYIQFGSEEELGIAHGKPSITPSGAVVAPSETASTVGPADGLSAAGPQHRQEDSRDE